MHILNIMQCTNLGGTEHATLSLMQGLQERGHSFEVISTHPLGMFNSKLKQNCIPAVGVPYVGKLGWRSHFQFRRAVRSVQADAVIMSGPTITGILALSARPRERRVLAVHFHHTGVNSRWAWQTLYRLAMARFQAITFPSDFVRHEALDILPALEPISHTVYNPLTIPPLASAEAKASARARLGLPLDRPLVGNAGQIIKRKRFDVFLQVAARVLERIPEAMFVIAGDGVARAELEELARKLRISDHIHWVGWQTKMDEFYPALDIMLFNSDWDAMGLSPMEAAACGVPVVASLLHGGLSEIMGNGAAALLIAKHDVEQMAVACVELLENHSLAREKGLFGRERIATRCSVAEATDRFEQLLGIDRATEFAATAPVLESSLLASSESHQ